MAASGDAKCPNFYAVLEVDKECTAQEMRIAYKRLALRWHPDRCSGNTRSVEEAKKKFQGIQEAYSVLSDYSKRFAYDIGMYQNDDPEDNNMGEFLSEMASMMNQTKPCETGNESLEQLRDLFNEMFQDDINFASSSSSNFSSFDSSLSNSYGGSSNSRRKRQSADYEHGSFKNSTTQFHNIHSMTGNASSSSSSSCNNGKIKRRNSGTNYH